MATKMKEKYNMTRDEMRFKIASINNQAIQFVSKELAVKCLWKIQPTQVTAKVIIVAEQYIAGVQMN